MTKLFLMRSDYPDDGSDPRVVTADLALDGVDDPNPPRHLEVGKLTLGQAKALRSLRRALVINGARLESGRDVVTNADTVRWLLEWMGGDLG
jgi:hypothetical protein